MYSVRTSTCKRLTATKTPTSIRSLTITSDLLGSRDTDIGTFSAEIQNLLDKECSTVWGQRATLFCLPTHGPAHLYDYRGWADVHVELVDSLLID